jgi:hypothetical protein
MSVGKGSGGGWNKTASNLLSRLTDTIALPLGIATAVLADASGSVKTAWNSGSTSIGSLWSSILPSLARFGSGDCRVDDAFDSVEMMDELASDAWDCLEWTDPIEVLHDE